MRQELMKIVVVTFAMLGLLAASFSAVLAQQAVKTEAASKAKSTSSELNDAQRRIDRLEAQIAEMQSIIGALQTLVQKGVAQNPVRSTTPYQQKTPEKVLTEPDFKTDGWGADTRSDTGENRLQDGQLLDQQLQQPEGDRRLAEAPGTRLGSKIGPEVGADLPIDARGLPSSKVIINGEPARKLYDAGYNYLMASNYTSAESTFRSFLSNYPKDPLSGNAQYWLGETYFARGDYRRAANEFLTGYKSYKTNQKAPDNLLKLGMSLHRLGQSEAACQTYSELSSKYKSLPGHVNRRLGEEKSKASCR